MKTYKFEITVDDFKKVDDFAQSLLDEINEEKCQLELTKKINRETSNIHCEILTNFINETNASLKTLDMAFGEIKPSMYRSTNDYKLYVSYITFNSCSTYYAVQVQGKEERGYSESKYTTYLGEYNICVGCGDNFEARENIGWYHLDKKEPIKGLLDRMRNTIKKELENR